MFKNKYLLTTIFLIVISIFSASTFFYNFKNNSKIHTNRTLSINHISNSIIKSISDNYYETFTNKGTLTDNTIKYNSINTTIGIPVLYYHSVNYNSSNEVIITPELFKEHMMFLKDEGYKTLSMKDVYDYLINNHPIPEKSILITFDDGYMDNYHHAFPILKELNMTATIFCITDSLDGLYYLSETAIKEMSDYGIDIQSHTVTHPYLDTLTYEEQFNEMINSKNKLEKITGKKVYSIAYPYGHFNDNSIIAAKEAGYVLGFTTNRGLSDREDDYLKLDRIYVNSNYNTNTLKNILDETKELSH